MRYDKLLLALLFIVVAAEARVYAYTDPGSGTLILQLLLAALFGLMFYIRRIIAWARGLVKGRENAADDEPMPAEPEK